eukprot:1136927-Pelagomonas_calceolata.AAC.14
MSRRQGTRLFNFCLILRARAMSPKRPPHGLFKNTTNVIPWSGSQCKPSKATHQEVREKIRLNMVDKEELQTQEGVWHLFVRLHHSSAEGQAEDDTHMIGLVQGIGIASVVRATKGMRGMIE